MVRQSTIDLIKKYEGCKLNAYQDSAGIWTIGYGTILYPNGFKVKQGDSITSHEADLYLSQNIDDKFEEIKSYVIASLNQNQWDAILSLVYNIGTNAFKQSTLLKRINSGIGDIRSAFLMWNKIKKKVKDPVTGKLETKLVPLDGLTNRRTAEADLYFKPI